MKKKGMIYLLLFICCLQGAAQKTGLQSTSMKYGENLIYDAKFKWGLMMMRAGEASFTYKPDRSINGAISQLQLCYKSVGFFDGFFKMRDTLTGYYNENNRLIYGVRRAHEGSYKEVEEQKFNYEAGKTTIHSLRYTPTRVKVDTTLTTVGEVSDMLSVFYYLRGWNRRLLQHGDVFPIIVAVGRDLVKVQFIYQNQSIIEYDNAKFNTHYFKIDIFDDAFESTKTSAEIWIGDDDNFFPIKLRTKLKLGYVEIYYKSSSGLAHPLSCRIEMKK